MQTINIAIDGPSASGKGTLAKKLAQALGLTYLDTGSFYRGLAYECLRQNVDLSDEALCVAMAQTTRIEIRPDNSILINGSDVTQLIRNDHVSQAASRISKFKGVRDVLVAQQKKIAAQKGFILDGRDIGSVVLPDADLKLYVTADANERAQRRYLELMARGYDIDYETVYRDIMERDRRDMTREQSPLIKVNDAIEVDTTRLSIEEALSYILNNIESWIHND